MIIMDKRVIERLEVLVEKISGCYTSIAEDILIELNNLTKNDWSEAEYIEFCAEYWSRSTLEETVYALLHSGEYPNNVESDLYFWKSLEKMELSDTQIMFKLRKLPETLGEVVHYFEDLPIKEFYNWLCSYFAEWNIDKELTAEDIQDGYFKVNFDCDCSDEYAKYKYIVLKVKGNKLINLECCNVNETEKQDIISFANKYNLHLYEDE